MEKRRHRRMALTGMVADISDGKGFFSGAVHDISRFGLALENLPERINSRVAYLSVIIDGQGGHFKLKIRPLWETEAGSQKSIGGQIENAPFAWTEFVMGFEPESDDIWESW